jgi:hypothetical protein
LGFTGGTSRTLVFPDWRDWAPRLGVTWRPTSSDKLVIRTGYGIFYDLSNLNVKEFVSGNPVTAPTQLFNTSFGDPPPTYSGTPVTAANVFATGSIPLLNEQYSALWVEPNFVTPRVQEWSFGIESQLGRDYGLEIDYVGTTASHLDGLHFFGNQPEPGNGALQSRRPYVDFNSLAYFTSDANSNYNSLQAKLTKRFSRGFLLLVAYTYAKGLSDNEGNEGSYGVSGNLPQDANNFEENYGRGVGDVRQRFVLSSVWRLPVGKGQHFMDRSGVANVILGNWNASGILSLQSGFPFTITSSQDFSNTNSQSPRPDRICQGDGPRTVADWFDTNCFTTDALEAALTAGTPRFGNSGRNIMDGPGLTNLDLALYKDFHFNDRVHLEFRCEAFDSLNQAQFGLPESSVGTGNFGAIGSSGGSRDIQFSLKLVY